VLRPAWPADPQKGPFPEVLQIIRRLLIRPGCFRLERELPSGICTHDICAPWQGTQWNKIEHRLFSFITMNWKATPLVSYRVIVDLIGATQTKTGLAVRCELDSTEYPKGIVVSDQEMDNLHMTRDAFHGEWNYTIHPSARHSMTSPPTEAVNSE
jgi:Rhodopirellula transposase DDE domain